jgi:hypothetical protein
MAINYPTSLDTTVGKGPSGSYTTTATNDVTFPHGGAHTDISAGVVALETLVGITNSTVTTTHEYRIRRNFYRVWTALDAMPPATLYATFGTVNSTPFLAFNDSATWGTVFIEATRWGAVLTSGVVIRLRWASATATTGSVVWGVAMERFGILTVASDHFDTQATATTTTNGTVEIITETDITLTTINSVVAGDVFRLQVQRLGANGSDTMVGDAQLFSVSIENAL